MPRGARGEGDTGVRRVSGLTDGGGVSTPSTAGSLGKTLGGAV